MFVDTHCHIYQLPEPEKIIEECLQKGVKKIVVVSEDRSSMEKVLELKVRFSETIMAGLGIHPELLIGMPREEWEKTLQWMEKESDKIDVIGETGLDYKYASTPEERDIQKEVLERHFDLAAKIRVPVNLHSRWAQRQTLEEAILFKKKWGGTAQLHWFTSSKKLINIANDEGIYISVGPSVLHSEETERAAREISLNLVLLETDSPVPYQGVPATPDWIPRVAEKLARLRNITKEELEIVCWENFNRFLNKS